MQILVAFVVQSVIAVFLSISTFVLSNVIQIRWGNADPNPRPLELDGQYPAWLQSWLVNSYVLQSGLPGMSLINISALLPVSNSHGQQWKALEKFWVWRFMISKQPEHVRLRTDKSKIGDEITPTTKRLKFANKILLAGNDAQTLTGILASLRLST